MGVLVQDSFEGGTVGQPPSGLWTRHVPTGGAVEIAADPVVGGTRGKVLKISEGVGSTGDYAEAKLVLSQPRTAVTWVLEVYPMQGSKTLYFGFYAGGTRYDLLALWPDGKLKYKRASDSTFVDFATPVTYSANTAWQRLRFVVDQAASSGELVMVTKDGADAMTAALDLPSIPAAIEAVAVATDVAEDNVTIYLNDVEVLEKSARLEGVVRDQTGMPLAGMKVVALRSKTGATLTSAVTDARGVFVLTVDSGQHVCVFAFDPALSNYGAPVLPWVWPGA